MTDNERTNVTNAGCCRHCKERPTSNGLVLCKHCRTTTVVALQNVGTYHAELPSLGNQAVRIRSRAMGVADPTGTLAAGRQIEKDPIEDLLAETRSLLSTWVRILVDDRDLNPPHGAVSALAPFLAKHVASIATLEWAAEFLSQLLDLERRLRRKVDSARGRWYAGICSAQLQPERPHDQTSCGCSCHLHLHEGLERVVLDCDVPGGCGKDEPVIPAELCDRDLYAIPGSRNVRCPGCMTDHLVSQRRAILLAEARDTLLPISVIASAAVTLLGSEPSVGRLQARLEKWAQRGRIKSYGSKVIGGQERRVYAFGEVLDMLTAEAAGISA